MTGRNKRIVGFGVAFGVLVGGSASWGLEVVIDRQAFVWGDGGIQFVQPVLHVPDGQTQDGFVVAASGTAIQDTTAGEAIKLIEQGQWVKAIQTIESLSATDTTLVVDERGVLRPLSAMKSALIASMPEAGRRTFSKLNDPAADTALAQALKQSELKPRALALKSIVDDYALCDAAAAGAQHLGDIRFEQGRFSEAAAYYRFASEHPATKADDPALMARRLTALARAEQWREFDGLAEYARFRHPDTSVRIAGADKPMQSLVAGLVVSRSEVPAHQPEAMSGPLVFPRDMELDYDKRLIDDQYFELLKLTANNHSIASIIEQTIAPVIATDGKRVFTLALGRVTRLDPQAGTELWSEGEQVKTIKTLQSRMYKLTNGYHQSLVVHEDTVLASVPRDNNRITAHLTALDAESGAVKWTLKDQLRSSSDTVVGEPLVVDDLVYVLTAHSSQGLMLRAVKLADGAQVAELALGRASKGTHLNAPAEFSPRLTMGQGHLMVQTNNGALIAVDPNNLSVAWAFTQKIRPSGLNMIRRHGQAIADPIARHTGEVVAIDGLIVAKDTRANQVVALREYNAAIAWTAQCDSDATIVHHDEKHVYVLGKELVALDRRTGERVWWTPHPGERSGQPVFTKDACLIAGSQRLCRIDLVTGKLTHYREDLAEAAALHVVGDRLISIAGQRLTAIALP